MLRNDLSSDKKKLQRQYRLVNSAPLKRQRDRQRKELFRRTVALGRKQA